MPGTAEEDIIDDEDLSPEEVEDLDQEDEAPEEGEGLDAQDEDEAAADEFTVDFDEEAEPPPESAAIRALRERNRELERRLAAADKPKPIEVGAKPTIADFYGQDGDTETLYEAALDAWKERKRQAEEQEANANKSFEAQRAIYNEALADYGREKAALKVRDFDSAEALVTSVLTLDQQAFLVAASDKPAQLTYALGKHPERLAKLAEIEHPIKFAAAVAKLEGSLKVNTKTTKKAPPPEETARGSAPLAKGSDPVLAKMEREAERNPNYDRGKIVRYKREQEAKKANRR